MKQGFTLIEMIIVIIIVGVLAAVGMIEYRKVVERSRGAEARMVLGDIRKLAYEYYLENGTTAGITNAHVNIGGSAGQFPSPCRSTHYFQYAMTAPSSTSFESHAWRCTANGKSPQGLPSDSTMCDSCRVLQLTSDFSTGTDTWTTWGVY